MSDDGYKRLSAAIVIEAFQDATGMKLSMTGSHTPRNKGAKRRQEARAFIESERLEMWCSVLDMDPDAIRDRVRSPYPLVSDKGYPRRGGKHLLQVRQTAQTPRKIVLSSSFSPCLTCRI